TIVSYSWDFGDGSTGSGVTVTHTYSAPGNYKATLIVTDDGDMQDTCNKEVVIKKNKKPEAKIEYSLLEENIAAFDGSSSSDEDGTIVSYSWDFGDGSTGSGVTVTHTYSAPGNYKATLIVTDDGDMQDTC
ncbi:MAG: PKD domain-containing protein, partial [Actinobacteria bacterium]|nr:PKD domain-containing protein [Actinomycetota bacterium]